MRQLNANRYSSDCGFCAAHSTEKWGKFTGCKKTTAANSAYFYALRENRTVIGRHPSCRRPTIKPVFVI